MLAVGAAEDLLRGASGGDDDVGTIGLGVELVEGKDLGGTGGAAQLGGEALGAGLGAVGDYEIGGAVLNEVTGGEFGHLARSHEQDRLSIQRTEDLPGEVDRNRGDGDAGRADLGLGADALGDGEGTLQEAFEGGGDSANLAGDGVGLLDLAKNLGLADDHGVERAGDAEEMADGIALAELVEVRREGGEGDAEELFEEPRQALRSIGALGRRIVEGFLSGEELDAIAGGENEAFADTGLVDERAGGLGEARGGHREALADLDGRCIVIDAEQDESARRGGVGRAGRRLGRIGSRGAIGLGFLGDGHGEFAHGAVNL